ncbi:20 kDa chaperonin, chloroplastic-like [Papaver somniferum]|uniref:20 kDa chaperonin, chloroplastic-like n=1 Tax=Papaver somniferum TaxID=3469 RepID=UPI000E70050D|nr:20 kDa chaperonin, chloroplastic-like [Papaver somniferum]
MGFNCNSPSILISIPSSLVLVVTKTVEQKTTGGIQSPSTAQTKPQGSELLSIEKVKTVGKAQVDVSVKTGAQIIYSKYAGTEVDLNGVSHLLLNDDGIVGILETEDVKDFKPLSEHVLINVEEAEKETAGGLLLTEDSKEKPSIGTVILLGTGHLNEQHHSIKDYRRKSLS